MRVALYARVSTGGQDVTNQLPVLRQWAGAQGHTVGGEYTDVASGARRRERLDDLFEDARKRKFDIVAIWSLDRLTREGPLATLLYISRLAALGIKTYSHQEPYLDPRLPFYESIVAFLADIAKWERERRSERTRAGLRRAVATGKKLGRPKGSRDRRKRMVRRQVRRALSGPLS
ncbi:MAG: recombinase family protein [Chloroflexi bacterium]|nr:recombinase family protein [Chloroflexota bacterium]